VPSSSGIAISGSGDALTLGAPAPRNPTATLPLIARGLAKLCWTIGSISNVCAPTVLDSGTASMELYGGRLAKAPTGHRYSGRATRYARRGQGTRS
jgi:hypothetical protein